MRLPINIGNQHGVSPKPSSYLFHHNILNIKGFLFFSKNVENWHSVCFIFINSKSLPPHPLAMDGMKRLRGIIISVEEKEYGSFVKTHFSRG
jgi:hypothetical protein